MKQLSKDEMKNVIGGLFDDGGFDSCPTGSCDFTWKDQDNVTHTTGGTCRQTQQGDCYCSNGVGRCNRIYD